MSRAVSMTLIALSLALAIPRVADAQSADAARVAKLRREVDELASKLAAKRAETQDELRALRVERAELERQVRLERVRARTLAELAKKSNETAAGAESRLQAWLEPTRRALQATRGYVESSVPYRKTERLQTLDKIAVDIEGPRPDPGRAVTRLWRFVEEEEAWATEVAIDQQAIELAGQRSLVQVIRLGAAILYFQTPKGELGWARQNGGEWQFEVVGSSLGREVIASLFRSFQQNRRVGPMTLWLPRIGK
ncbi:MAG: DUF3450 domain-containing protein [Deltaproteobacteria bacterium]|nr:DUF3450 domain-containing protein [Deltaproteobacteria bacterium]